MRSMSSTMQRKVASRIQAGENGMSASLWVGRPTTPLTDDTFLEKQTVLNAANITKTSLAVCHPQLSRGATHIYFAYIEAGELKITRTYYVDVMERHEWELVEFSEWAEDVALCFDGTMPKAPNGWVEFKTEQVPWVFWVLNGVLYGRKLNDTGDPIVLAEANCSAVSAVRAMWSSHGGFDFGLVVFFLLSGQLYYRQLIEGEWMDAEIVSFGPDGVNWEALAAFRTWDYRVGVQLKSTDGAFYEMFTQFMGVGKQNTEHLSVDVKVQNQLIPIKYSNFAEIEHIEAQINPEATRIYGLSSVPVSAHNLDDGMGNWGVLVQIVMDYPVTKVEENTQAFSLADSYGNIYTCTQANTLDGGRIIQLAFLDFNLAEGGNLTVTYSPGGVLSPAVALNGFSFEFIPQGLVAPNIPVPEPVAAWNANSEGTEVVLQFSQPLVGDITGLETPVGYEQKALDLSDAVVTTLNQYSSSYPGTKAVDGNTSTYWRSSTTTSWLTVQLSESKAVNHLRLMTNSRKISTFTLSGSNDGSTWTQLGDTFTVSSTSGWNDFDVDNDQSYSYYRVDVLTGSSTVCIVELELQESVAVGNETKFTISGESYLYVPDGYLVEQSRNLVTVTPDAEDNALVHLGLSPGTVNSIRNFVGSAMIHYSGGTLRGKGGPVADFSFEFIPDGLIPKSNPHEAEHIESIVTPHAQLKRITHSDYSENEHISVVIVPEGTLTHVDDI